MIDWSIISILNLSIAHGNSHKLISLMILALAILWELCPSLGKLIHIFFVLLRDDIVGAAFLCNSSEGRVLVHRGLGDWDHGVDDVPKDAFEQRGCGQGSLVSEAAVEVDQLYELAKVQGRVLSIGMGLRGEIILLASIINQHLSMLLLIDQVLQELVMI